MITLKFRFFDGNVRGFTKFLVCLTKMGFEINPSFVSFRTMIPFCNGSLEPARLVYDDVGFRD